MYFLFGSSFASKKNVETKKTVQKKKKRTMSIESWRGWEKKQVSLADRHTRTVPISHPHLNRQANSGVAIGLQVGICRPPVCFASFLLFRLAGRVRHGLRALRHGVLRQLSRQHNAHSRLHLAGTEGALLVRAHDRRSLRCDALHHVVHVRVHDPHRAARHRHLAVDCLEGAVDVHVPRTLRLAVRLARSLGGSRARSGHDCEGGKRGKEERFSVLSRKTAEEERAIKYRN